MEKKEREATHPSHKRRKAEFSTPLNLLRAKVGYGGLSEETLDKAQAVIESTNVDFGPMAEMYLSTMMRGIERARNPGPGRDSKNLIAGMLYPAMQLKANGTMFRYPLVTRISDRLTHFLETISGPDSDALEIVSAFHTTIRAVRSSA